MLSNKKVLVIVFFGFLLMMFSIFYDYLDNDPASSNGIGRVQIFGIIASIGILFLGYKFPKYEEQLTILVRNEWKKILISTIIGAWLLIIVNKTFSAEAWPNADFFRQFMEVIRLLPGMGAVVFILGGGCLIYGLRSQYAGKKWVSISAALFLPVCYLLITSGQLREGLIFFYLLILAFFIGLACLRLLKYSNKNIGLLFMLTLSTGLGILSLVVLLVGELGGLYPSAVWIGSAALLGACGFLSFPAFKVYIEKSRANMALPDEQAVSWPLVLGALSGYCIFCLAFIGAIAPETMFDALKSHLALAKIYATDHAISGLTRSIGSYWPLGGDLLFTVGYLLGGETTAKLFQFVAGMIAAGIIYFIGKRLLSVQAGMAGALVYLTTPIVAWELTNAAVDLILGMYCAASVAFFLDFLRKPSMPSAIGAGLSIGFSLGVKPSGIILLFTYAVLMLLTAPRKAGEVTQFVNKWVLLMCLVAFASGGIWYARAYVITGNPFFPFMNNVFNSPLWANTNENFNFDTFGIGISLPSFVHVFWDLTWDTSTFGEVPRFTFSLIYLAFVPIGLFFIHKNKTTISILYITALIFCITWFFSVQYLRYLIPGIPVLAILAGWASTKLWKISLRRKNIFVLGELLIAFLLFTNLIFFLNYQHPIRSGMAFEVALGRISRSAYRNQLIPSAEVYAFGNQHLRETSYIYTVGDFYQYLSDFPILFPFNSIPGNQIFHAKSVDELLELLKAEGITVLLVNHNFVDSVKWNLIFKDQKIYDQHSRLLFTNGQVSLYCLEDSNNPNLASSCLK